MVIWRCFPFLKFLVVMAHVGFLVALPSQGEQQNTDSNLTFRLTSNVSGSADFPSLIELKPLPHTCRNGASFSGLRKGWHNSHWPASPYSFNDDSREGPCRLTW